MKNKSAPELIRRLKELGFTVDIGTKHAKIKTPNGKMVGVISVNGKRDLYDIDGQIRKYKRMLDSQSVQAVASQPNYK